MKNQKFSSLILISALLGCNTSPNKDNQQSGEPGSPVAGRAIPAVGGVYTNPARPQAGNSLVFSFPLAGGTSTTAMTLTQEDTVVDKWTWRMKLEYSLPAGQAIAEQNGDVIVDKGSGKIAVKAVPNGVGKFSLALILNGQDKYIGVAPVTLQGGESKVEITLYPVAPGPQNASSQPSTLPGDPSQLDTSIAKTWNGAINRGRDGWQVEPLKL